MLCTHIQKNGVLFNHKHERNSAICNITEGPWGHYAKWNKSNGERQVLYDLIHMWNLKRIELTETNNRLEAANPEAEGRG